MFDPTPPILEFDPAPTAVVEPHMALSQAEMPERVVICYFREVIAGTGGEQGVRRIGALESEMGTFPIFEIDDEGRRVAIAQGGIGAPLAGGWLDELISFGGRAFVAIGGAGALVPGLTLGQVVVRDEGTSYHYLAPSREVGPTDDAVAAIISTLDRHSVPHVEGKTWTTDGYYRETRGKVERRVAEGCLTVEMEASAFFAVARFRGVSFGQMLMAGDDLSGEAWNRRGWNWHADGRQRLFALAVEAVNSIKIEPRRRSTGQR